MLAVIDHARIPCSWRWPKYCPAMTPRASTSSALVAHRLRLTETRVYVPTRADEAGARRAVAQEMHAAALGADDVRWALANQVNESVEGGRAAIMRPESRRRLVSNAEK